MRIQVIIPFSEMAEQNVCGFFKFGYCKFRNKCRKMHVSEKCERKTCDIKSCNLRHPKICRYFRDRKFCKFGEWCCFDHKNIEEDFEKVSEKYKQTKLE